MPFLETQHHALHYTTAGSKQQPALLMLHGFLGSCQDFENLLPKLSKHFYCILPDLPGHGQTQTKPNSYTFSTTAQSLLSLLNTQGSSRPHLLGYSMGGRIALYMACHFPAQFANIILESASPGLKTQQERQERVQRDETIAQKLETLPLSDFLDTWYQNKLFESLRNHPQLYATMRSRRQNNRPLELAQALRGFSTGAQPPLWKALPHLNKPLLLIVGEKDFKFIKIAREIAAARQQNESHKTTVKCCPDCGHNVHLESPSWYTKTIAQIAT